MFEPDESAKREEDRINRTLNNAGRRGARPVSWNVPSSNSQSNPGNKGDALSKLQEQLKEDERKRQLQQLLQQEQQLHQQQLQQQQSSEQNSNGHISSHLASDPPKASTPEKEFLDADKDKRNRQEEERLERWLRKGGTRFEGSGATSPDFRHPARSPSPSLSGLGIKFQDQIVHASKSLRLRKSDDLARWCFTAASTAKSIAELVSEEGDILNYVKALEGGASSLRANLDSGGDGTQFFYEISGYLGQLYIATIGAV